MFLFFLVLRRRKLELRLFELNGMKTKLKKRQNVFHSTFFSDWNFRLWTLNAAQTNGCKKLAKKGRNKQRKQKKYKEKLGYF